MKIRYIAIIMLVCLVYLIYLTSEDTGVHTSAVDVMDNILSFFRAHSERITFIDRKIIECTPITPNTKLGFEVGEELLYREFFKPLNISVEHRYVVDRIEIINSTKHYWLNASEQQVHWSSERSKSLLHETEDINITIETVNYTILISDEGKIKFNSIIAIPTEKCESMAEGVNLGVEGLDIIAPWMLALNEEFVFNLKYEELYEHNGKENLSRLEDEIRVIGVEEIKGKDCFVVKKTYDIPKVVCRQPGICEFTHLRWIDKDRRILAKGESYDYTGNLTSRIELID